MRELTEYEKKKWGEKPYEFSMTEDDFLSYGDELGEAFLAALTCTGMGDYGLSDEFVALAVRECLDMYYYQIHLYTGAYGGYDTPEDVGLPPFAVFREKAIEHGLGQKPVNHLDSEFQELFDWAMEWRDEHREETYLRQRKESLQRELARLEEGHGRNA